MNPGNDLGVRPGESDSTRMLGLVLPFVFLVSLGAMYAGWTIASVWRTPKMDCRVSARLRTPTVRMVGSAPNFPCLRMGDGTFCMDLWPDNIGMPASGGDKVIGDIHIIVCKSVDCRDFYE